MENIDFGLRVAGFIVSCLAVYLAFLKQRDVLFAKVRTDFVTAANSHLLEVESRMHLLEVTVESRDLSIEQCERQRDAALEALASWHNLVGEVWLDATKTANPGY